ncbi:TonB family protein [Halomicronema sp. CCY15110]|uniref:TonB family protein n=1 Tax=Halomicronema sp. CCY15110 TaxID=2767773 RepID=UPI00195192C0|nr:TonB family protein [Halomicronema sp. CCY15110]
MSLSRDCVDYRDRQQARTQRWVLWGVVGAVGLHVGGLAGLRWSPSDAAQLAPEDRIQVTVLPSPAAIAETALPTPAASPASATAPSPATPPRATSATPAVALAPGNPASDRSDAALPNASELTVAPPEPESAAIAPPAAAAARESAEDTSLPEPLEDSSPDAEVAEPLPDLEAIADTLPMADDAPHPNAAPSPAASEDAMSGNGAALEAANGKLTDALSRLSEHREPSGAAASSSATAPTGHPSTPVARNIGPDQAGPGDAPATDSSDTGSKPANAGDRTVSCRHCPRPAYPSAALDAGSEGQPVVNVQFSANGHVIGVTLEQSSGHAELDQAALAALQSWQFATGGQGGSVSVEIPFVIEGSQRHRAAQQQGDRESATVNADTPTATTSPTQPPASAATAAPNSNSDAADNAAENAETVEATPAAPQAEASESETVSSNDEDTSATENDVETPDPTLTEAGEGTAIPANDEPAETSPSEPLLPAAEPIAEPTAADEEATAD